MARLLDLLADRCADDLVWIGPNRPRLTVDDVRQAVDSGQDAQRALRGKCVALGNLPVVEFVLSLVQLDGLAARIVLLPPEDDAATRAERLRTAEVEHVLENDGLALASRVSHWRDSRAADRPALATEWWLPTSGTTGTPKLIAHTLASLTRGMSGRRPGDGFVWGSLYNLRRFAGLQVLLQAWLAGTPLVLAEDNTELPIVLQRLAAAGCNALSATPSMWRKMSMLSEFDALALRQITLGGEIVDQPVLDMLKKRFPEARITHIYASTEAGVGFAVRDGLAGFPRTLFNQPIDGVELRLADNQHLWIKPPNGNWTDTGDIVDVIGGRGHFLGRANGSINVGGNKVMPEEVEGVIRELPEVAFVCVRARKSAILGSLVEAAVALMPGYELDPAQKKKILVHCSNRLESFKVPAFIVPFTNVQLSAAGKLIRIPSP
ncbi:MAG: class I adenylate-forming enzyme family protein [Burkholderiaceae bacterium]